MPQLTVIGGGPLELALRDYVAGRHITNIAFTGRLSTEQVQEHMRRCALGVIPSECCETFGLSILEFYLQGKPVVASDIGSISQIVESGQSGLLFEPGMHGNLAEQVRWLYARPDEIERMGRRGRELVEQVYTPDKIHERLLSIMAAATESARA
jgi:glycosyltransferase involved in cell wall biosynthesis